MSVDVGRLDWRMKGDHLRTIHLSFREEDSLNFSEIGPPKHHTILHHSKSLIPIGQADSEKKIFKTFFP